MNRRTNEIERIHKHNERQRWRARTWLTKAIAWEKAGELQVAERCRRLAERYHRDIIQT